MISTRFTELVGCRLPLQQAGMGGVSTPALARAVADAGGLGMLSGVMAVEPMEGCIGVNFLMPFVDPGLVEAAGQWARVVEFFYELPDESLVRRAGAAVAAWQVGSADEARAAVSAGCRLVVAQGVEAGGHVRGATGLLPLLDEVLAAVGHDVPVVAAGGIGTAGAVRAALAAGADAVRVGTRFVAAEEADAHADYVAALAASTADDTVLTTAFSAGWPDAPHRVLRACVKTEGGFVMPPLRDSPGDVSGMAMYAGQSVGSVRGVQPAAEIVAELMNGLAP